MYIVYEYIDENSFPVKLVTTETDPQKVSEFIKVYEKQFGNSCETYVVKKLFNNDDKQSILDDFEKYHMIHVDMEKELHWMVSQ